MKRSLLQVLISGLSGVPARIIKLTFLALLNAVAVYGIMIAIPLKSYAIAAFIAVMTLLLDYALLSPRNIPLKYFAPGTVFLVAFSLFPTFYTIGVAFTNYSTGHAVQKREAVQTIVANSVQQIPGSMSYDQIPACRGTTANCSTAANGLVMIFVDQVSGAVALGTTEGLKGVREADLVYADAEKTLLKTVQGYTPLTRTQVANLNCSTFVVPTGADSYIQGDCRTAFNKQPTLRYDAKSDTFTSRVDASVYKDNGKGSYIAVSGPHTALSDPQHELLPGWMVRNGFGNFQRIISDKDVRTPFIRVFIWTVVFALSTVLTTFILGLALALVLNKAKMRGVKIYRSFLIIPYAAPALLTILIWSGMLNQNNGIINALLDVPWIHSIVSLIPGLPDPIPWTGNAFWAKISILTVNLWLGFPYMFLIATGALQAIPQELSEAAEVDGATPWQILRRIKAPLLLIATGPLLVASFAYNFNNFNIIYLLTGGGPAMKDVSSVAGETDILISYTYKLAFDAGKGSQFGLSSAVSIIIFFIVAAMSGPTFWRSKAMEAMN
ncbi:MAG: ABC transporter permease subunit [Actinomycetales bacterium]|nr:ABC transporter permease subunit [Actinomycetales bacterium]